MTQELSALMDGELGADEAGRAIGKCCGDEELKCTWQAYHVIGEALRGEGLCRGASTRRIMEAIAKEPTVLAPVRRPPVHAGRIAFAAAASVATVAVVGWIGLQDRGSPAGPVIAKSAPAAAAARPLVASNVVPLNNVNEYLVVHRQLPNADFYRPVSNQAAGGR
jgi:sigma-E factor negative regulatory protein RseA